MAFAVVADDRLGLGVGQVLDALLGAEVELHPEALVLGVDEAVGVAAEAVHVAEAARDAAIAHDDRDLVQRLGQQRPEVPVVVGAAHAGARIALDGVVEVGELQRIAEEEHRRVVADDVPVAFFGVELQGEAADVALGVGRAALAGDGREAREHRGLLADLGEDLRLGVAGDVVGDGEGAEGARSPWRACAARGSPRGRTGPASRGTRHPAAAPGRAGRRSGCCGCRRPARRWRGSSLVFQLYYSPQLNLRGSFNGAFARRARSIQSRRRTEIRNESARSAPIVRGHGCEPSMGTRPRNLAAQFYRHAAPH